MTYFGDSSSPPTARPAGWVCTACLSSMAAAELACFKCGVTSEIPESVRDWQPLPPKLPVRAASKETRKVVSQDTKTPVAVPGPSHLLRLRDVGFSEIRLTQDEIDDIQAFSRSLHHSFSLKVDPTHRWQQPADDHHNLATSNCQVHFLGSQQDVKKCAERISILRKPIVDKSVAPKREAPQQSHDSGDRSQKRQRPETARLTRSV
jgi:hypothetical protein